MYTLVIFHFFKPFCWIGPTGLSFSSALANSEYLHVRSSTMERYSAHFFSTSDQHQLPPALPLLPLLPKLPLWPTDDVIALNFFNGICLPTITWLVEFFPFFFFFLFIIFETLVRRRNCLARSGNSNSSSSLVKLLPLKFHDTLFTLQLVSWGTGISIVR